MQKKQKMQKKNEIIANKMQTKCKKGKNAKKAENAKKK